MRGNQILDKMLQIHKINLYRCIGVEIFPQIWIWYVYVYKNISNYVLHKHIT